VAATTPYVHHGDDNGDNHASDTNGCSKHHPAWGGGSESMYILP
jgi:hypothetical protein